MNAENEKPSRCRAGLITLTMVSIQKKANRKSMYHKHQNVTKKAITGQFAQYGQLVEGGEQ